MTLLSRACVSPYYYFIETMSVCRTVSEIFSVKERRDDTMHSTPAFRGFPLEYCHPVWYVKLN